MIDTAESKTNEKLKHNRYADYKDSGLEWIGEIPTHWEVIRVKNIFRLIIEPAPINNDYELLSVYTDIGVKPRKELEERGNRASTTDGYWLVKKGDIVINKLLAWMGAIGLSEYDGVTSPAYDILRAKRPISGWYYHALFRSPLCSSELKRHSRGIMDMRLRLYFDKFGDVMVPYPPYEEQTCITEFLDRKTAQIDQAIAQKERLIKLLNERRQVMIHKAVTRGLNSDVPMKDSGIEWIGEIPAHWEVKKLKYDFKLIGGGTPSKERADYWNGDIPWVSPKDMKTLYITSTEDYITEKGLKNSTSSLINSDVLIMVVRSGILQRKIPVAISKRVLSINQDIKALVPIGKIKTEFLLYFIIGNDSFLRNEWVKQGATVESVEMELLKNSFIVVPPKEDQDEIINFLDRVSVKINEGINMQIQEVQKLQELKSTLINSAVTGKIKV